MRLGGHYLDDFRNILNTIVAMSLWTIILLDDYISTIIFRISLVMINTSIAHSNNKRGEVLL